MGFAPVTPGLGATLTIQIPHAQAVQFTVGGIQLPSQLQISGAGPAGSVIPSASARSTVAGSATAVSAGSSVQITGAVDNGSGDGNPRDAVDVWFPAPVSTITVTLGTTGSATDAGFLLTAPIACQSGSISTTATVGEASVDVATGRVTHAVTMATTVRNSSAVSGAVLYPAVDVPFRSAAEAQGLTLENVVAGESSSAACSAVPGLDGSGPLITPSTVGLAPGAECTLAWTATVSAPQTAMERSVDVDSFLRSSRAPSSRLKAQASTIATFPGLASQLSLQDSGALQGQPGQRIDRSVTVVNNGAGAALGAEYSITAPEGAILSGLPNACTSDGRTASCTMGNLAPGSSSSLSYTLSLDLAGVPGSSLTVSSQATSSAQAAPATLTYVVTVIAAPIPPAIAPPPETTIEPRPRPAPTPSPVPDETPDAVEQPIPAQPSPATPTTSRSPIPMSLSFAAGEMLPGTASTLRGTLGPSASEQEVALSFSGRVNQGLVYRLVRVLVDGEDDESCVTRTRDFTCTVILEAGQRAEIEVRLFADALNAPAQAVQQLALTTDDGAGDNARTVTTDIASGATDMDAWTDAFALDMSTLDGAFLPLTAMMLLALAATVAERRRP